MVAIKYTSPGNQSTGTGHQGEIDASTYSSAISIRGSEVEADIRKHIENQLATDPKLKGWSDDLKACIKRTLVEKAEGM